MFAYGNDQSLYYMFTSQIVMTGSGCNGSDGPPWPESNDSRIGALKCQVLSQIYPANIRVKTSLSGLIPRAMRSSTPPMQLV